MSERTTAIIVVASAIVLTTAISAISNNLNNRMRLQLMLKMSNEDAKKAFKKD